MHVVIRNQAAAFLDWWDSVHEFDPARRARSWLEAIDFPGSDVFADYFPRFGRREDLEAALSRFDVDAGAIRAWVDSLVGSLGSLGQCVSELMGLPKQTVLEVVIMVGLYGSNAWTVEVNRAPVSYFAAERLPQSSKTRDALVAHELAHAAHRLLRRGPWRNDIASKLAEEALAIAVSAIVVPGLDDAAYATFDDRDQAWVKSCREQHERIVETAAGFSTPDATRAYEALFARQAPSTSLPARSGYYLARVLAEQCLSSRSQVRSFARLTSNAAVRQLADHLGLGNASPQTGVTSRHAD